MKWNKALLTLVTVFTGLYSLISLVNHYNFRTYALDLGLYTNALYKYGNLQLADSLMIKDVYEPMLGGHFDLYLILFSPLVHIFGEHTLLLVQIAAISFGGIGCYYYFRNSNDKTTSNLAIWASAYFCSFFGVFSAFSFDYHSVVVASGFMPWFFLAIKNRNMKIASIWFLVILIAQENVSFIMTFICLSLAALNRKDRRTRLLLLVLATCSVIYFLTVIYAVIPHFSARNEYGGFLYSTLGNSPLEALKNIINHPIESLKKLFVNHTENPDANFVKLEFHLFIIISGAYMLFKKPIYLLMLLPLYFQKLYHDNSLMWSFGGQYVVEFAPVFTLGIFSVLSSVKRLKTQRILLAIVMLGSVFTTVRMMDNTIQFTDKSRIRIYQEKHYKRSYSVKDVHNELLREVIYEFPKIADADFIVYSPVENPYPLSAVKFKEVTLNLLNSKEWTVINNNEELILLKRNNEP